MKILKFIPNEFASNNYLVFNEKTKNAILFDPSGCFFEIDKYIKENNLKLKALFVTHVHFDHVGDIKKYQDNYPDIKTNLPLLDKPLYDNLIIQCDMFCVKRVENFKVDEFIGEDSEIYLDEEKITVISGHSLGSTCYLIQDNLIAGDTLFYEEVGRCDLPTGSFSDITKSIKEKLFKLDKNIKVYAGHGEDTTIAHEIENNAYFGKNAIYK